MSHQWKVSIYHLPEKHLYKLFAMCFSDDDTLYRYVLNALNENELTLLDICNAADELKHGWLEPVIQGTLPVYDPVKKLELEGILANIYYKLTSGSYNLTTSSAYMLLSNPTCIGNDILTYLGLFEFRDIPKSGSSLSHRLENFINMVNRDSGLYFRPNTDTYFISSINEGILSTFVITST